MARWKTEGLRRSLTVEQVRVVMRWMWGEMLKWLEQTWGMKVNGDGWERGIKVEEKIDEKKMLKMRNTSRSGLCLMLVQMHICGPDRTFLLCCVLYFFRIVSHRYSCWVFSLFLSFFLIPYFRYTDFPWACCLSPKTVKANVVFLKTPASRCFPSLVLRSEIERAVKPCSWSCHGNVNYLVHIWPLDCSSPWNRKVKGGTCMEKTASSLWPD